ncbi:hypothetical protein AZA_26558 [Nitrospirillum viridazoti Y2]|uniref:Excisionase family DNA binding protein n=1 Tax=Nitrospirillum amazonense TaxID=28077 RepID=A0A560IT48_9PROT|nr:hypothetical protein [Nitrospirillum amazonense]EGX99734.1 hypothetical protein AZA_26558 [Nitrospirillum amazonense Y2]TWB62248.1 hypothetical protein FBZ92_105183 [Nitrospirillum amazonense]
MTSTKVAWTVAEFGQATSLGKTKIYGLMNDGTITSCKVGGKRLITVSPAEFLQAMPNASPAAGRIGSPDFYEGE